MKKQLLLLVSIAFSAMLFAQSEVTFGARVGVTSAGIRGDAANNLTSLVGSTNGRVTTRNLAGFFAGTYAEIPVTDGLFIEPGLFYTQKGYELKGSLNMKGLNFLGAGAKAQLQSQYIDIPLLLKVDAGGLEVFAGPQLSYLLHADLHTTAGLLGINILNSKLDASSLFNKWDAALTGGIGYNFGNGINLSASYDYGLQKMDVNRLVNAYNNVIKVGIGIRL